MSEVKVNGLAELQALLDSLPAKIEKNIVRGGLRAGIKVIKDEATRLCPVGDPSETAKKEGSQPGELRDSLRISLKVKNGKVVASLKAGNAKAFYAHMVEFGTARHLIKPKNRKSLFIAGLFDEVIDHPGAKKKPFMRPAIDGKAEDAITGMADYIRDRIPKELAKQS